MPESREVRALRQYLADSGVPHRVTSTCRPKSTTAAGYPSRHGADGTDGCGLAVDFAGPSYGRDTPHLAAVFFALLRTEHNLHELIYAGPQVDFNIKRGQRVPKYAESGHHDHVHVSVNKGVLIHWTGPTPTPDEEDDMTPEQAAQLESTKNAVARLETSVRDPQYGLEKRFGNLEKKVDQILQKLNNG